MNINKAITEFLTEQGCTIEEKEGILYVETPSGITWDLTAPEVSKRQKTSPEKREINGEEK